jgi:hypothetical protein
MEFRSARMAGTRLIIVRVGALLASIVLCATSADATPNMIRLGYPTCGSCHVSPQGGGLLTHYGEAIDLAQTLHPEEPSEPDLRDNDGLGSRLNYDLRGTLDIERDPPEPEGYGLNLSVRSAIGFRPQHRLVYTASVGAPTLTRTRSPGAISLGMSRLYWLYQPREGLSFVVGRDSLPSGLGFARRTTNPNVSSTPTQAKVFWWNKRWQLTAYGYGPDGNESQPRFEARGGGAVVGLNVWRDRAVVGLTTQVSRADAFDRENAGIFARVGLTKHFGILAEHDVTSRTLSTGADFTHVSGQSEVFFVPFDWLQTALTIQHLNTSGGDDTYRLSPSADVRVTSNIKVSFSMLDVYAPSTSRTYAFSVQVKTQ